MITLEKWDDCRTACKETKGCHYFEHHQETNSCYHIGINYETNENVISGEYNCSFVRDCPDCFKACFPGEPWTRWFNVCRNCNAKNVCTCDTICSWTSFFTTSDWNKIGILISYFYFITISKGLKFKMNFIRNPPGAPHLKHYWLY